MLYEDLLGKSWRQVERKDRRKATRRAYVVGQVVAEQALIGSGGSDLLNCMSAKDLKQFFFHYLIGDREFYRQISDEDRKYWQLLSRQECSGDPRIKAFSHGWRTFMEDEIVRSSPLVRFLLANLLLARIQQDRPIGKTRISHRQSESVGRRA